MKNPLHPGELVRDNLEDLNLSVAEAATGLGITRQQLYNVIGGKCAITPEMALRFEKGFGGTANFWLQMQANYDPARAREGGHPRRVTRFAPKVA